METDIPLILIRKMLNYFKINQPSQSFIEENVPSLHKLFTYPRSEIEAEASIMLIKLFDSYDLELNFNIFLTEKNEDTRNYFIHIEVEYDENLYKEILSMNENNVLLERENFRQELLLDRRGV